MDDKLSQRRNPMTDPTIHLGSTGPAVKKAQQQLNCRNYLPNGSDDGIFGPQTEKAVRTYQTDRSTGHFLAVTFPLDVDGIVGPQTWGRLAPQEISKGSKGSPVRLCQELLKRYGLPAYDPGPIDGDFGPITEGAVKAFQKDNTDHSGAPLKVDGIVGPKTWCALGS
jgi:peptidoglycan hydrolase-like protein with peptidoglycan-binding domain